MKKRSKQNVQNCSGSKPIQVEFVDRCPNLGMSVLKRAADTAQSLQVTYNETCKVGKNAATSVE